MTCTAGGGWGVREQQSEAPHEGWVVQERQRQRGQHRQLLNTAGTPRFSNVAALQQQRSPHQRTAKLYQASLVTTVRRRASRVGTDSPALLRILKQ